MQVMIEVQGRHKMSGMGFTVRDGGLTRRRLPRSARPIRGGEMSLEQVARLAPEWARFEVRHAGNGFLNPWTGPIVRER